MTLMNFLMVENLKNAKERLKCEKLSLKHLVVSTAHCVLRFVFSFCLLIAHSIHREIYLIARGNLTWNETFVSTPGMSFSPIFYLHLGSHWIMPDGYSQNLLEESHQVP